MSHTFLVKCGVVTHDSARQRRADSIALGVGKRHVYLACLLFEHGVGVTVHDNDESTPLHRASDSERRRVDHLASLLFEHGPHGVDATAQDNYRWTLLHRESERGHEDFASLPAEHSADVTAQDDDRPSPRPQAQAVLMSGPARTASDLGPTA
jgi:ankyrin repeat protein